MYARIKVTAWYRVSRPSTMHTSSRGLVTVRKPRLRSLLSTGIPLFTFTPYLWRTYDANRLLVSEETRENGLKYTLAYLWSYGNQYPVARIEGADYSDVTGWLSSASVGLPNTLTRPSDIESRLASIRNALASKTYWSPPILICHKWA